MQNNHNANLAVTLKQGHLTSTESKINTRRNDMLSMIVHGKLPRSHSKVVGDGIDEFNVHPWILPSHLCLAPRIDIWLAFAVSSCVAVASIGQVLSSAKGSGLSFAASDSFALSICAISFIFSFLISVGMYYVPLRRDLTKPLFSLGPGRLHDLRLTVELLVLSLLVFLWIFAIPIIMNGDAHYSTSSSRNVALAMSGSNVWNPNVFYSSWASFLLCVYLWVEVLTLVDRSGTLRVGSFAARNTFTKRWTLLFLGSVMLMSASIEIYNSQSCQGQVLKQTSFCTRALAGIFTGGVLQILVTLGVGALYQLSRTSPRVALNSKFREGCNILSTQERNIGSAIAAVISLVVQAANVGLLTRPAGGGPGNIVGVLYFGSWLGFALVFELCLRYLKFYTSASDDPSDEIYRRKGSGQMEDETVYVKDDDEEMSEDISIDAAESAPESRQTVLALYNGSSDSSYALALQNNTSSPSRHMITMGDTSVDYEGKESGHHNDQQTCQSNVFSYVLSPHNRPPQMQERQPPAIEYTETDKCRKPDSPPPGNHNYRRATLKNDFNARKARPKPVDPSSRTLKGTPRDVPLEPSGAKMRESYEEIPPTTDAPPTIDNDTDFNNIVLSPHHNAGDDVRTMWTNDVIHSIREADQPKKARSSKKSRSHEKETSVITAERVLNISGGNDGQTPRYSQPGAKSRNRRSSSISRKPTQYSESNIPQDHGVEQGELVPSISLQRFNALSIPDSSKIPARSRRRVTTASSVTLRDSKRSIQTPPLTISERSQIEVGSQISSVSTNHSNDQWIPRGLTSPWVPYSALEAKEDSRDEPPQSHHRDSSSTPVGSIHIHKNDHDVSDATLDSGLDQPPTQKLTSESQPSFKQNDLSPPPRQKMDGGSAQRHNSYSRKSLDKTYYSGKTGMRQSPERIDHPSSLRGGDADKDLSNIVVATLLDAEKNRREWDNHGFVAGGKVVDDIVAATLLRAEKNRTESGNQVFVARGSDNLSQLALKPDRSKSMPNRSTKKAKPKHNRSAPARLRIHKNNPDQDTMVLDATLDSGQDQSPKRNSTPVSQSTLKQSNFPPPPPQKKYGDHVQHLSSPKSDEYPSSYEEGAAEKAVDNVVVAALAYAEKTQWESGIHQFTTQGPVTTGTFSQPALPKPNKSKSRSTKGQSAKKAASKHSSSAPIQSIRIHKSRRESNTKLNHPTSEVHCRSSSSSESTLEKIKIATDSPPSRLFHLSSKAESSKRDEGSGNINTADTTQAAPLANADMTHTVSGDRPMPSKSERMSMTFSQQLQLLHDTQPKSKHMPHQFISDSGNQQQQPSLKTSAAMVDIPSSARSSLDNSDNYKRPFLPSDDSESSNTVNELVADALLRVKVLLEGSD